MPILVTPRTSHILTLMLCGFAGGGATFYGAGCDSESAGGAGASSGTGTGTGTGAGGAPGNTTSSASTNGGTGPGPSTSGPGSTSTSSTGGGVVDCGPAPAGVTPALKLTRVANGLAEPVLATGAPGDNDRLFIVERRGTIRILSNNAVLAQPFLDINAVVRNASGEEEAGLLGLAFHPGYAANGRFFVFYVTNDGDSVIVEYARSSNPNTATAAPTRTLFTISGDNSGQHYGGMLAFGKDGYLYASSGDRGANSGPPSAADIGNPRGKILRFDVENHPTAPPGNIPSGNPYVWDYGLRNPWRFSFDRCSGDMYLGDVGGRYEEINVEPFGQSHRNYGWPAHDTGDACDSGEDCTGITLAVVANNHNAGDGSFIGGYVYRGSIIPALNGRYLYGDWASNRIWTFTWTGDGIALSEDLSGNLQSTDTLGGISSFGEDTAGNLYVVDVSGGAVHRIDAR